MPVDPAQLLDLARDEATLTTQGAPRQVELRRAVSTAYYALFHALCGEIGYRFSRGRDSVNRLFYRSLDHGKTKQRCTRLALALLPQPEREFFDRPGFEPGLRQFADTFVRLQELRHACDYDPAYRTDRANVRTIIADAAAALDNHANASDDQRLEFLAYLLFGLR